MMQSPGMPAMPGMKAPRKIKTDAVNAALKAKLKAMMLANGKEERTEPMPKANC